jgi:hypothetical protein
MTMFTRAGYTECLTRPEKDVALNTAVGIALVLGLISFCVSFFVCLWVAINTELIPFHLSETNPQVTLHERLGWCACIGVPSLISWFVVRQTYRFFRNLSLPR